MKKWHFIASFALAIAKIASRATTAFTLLSRLGYLGNVALLVQTEWSLWAGDWVSLANPLFHLEALGLLIRNPVAWLFWVVAIASTYTVRQLEQERRRQQLQTPAQQPKTTVPVEAPVKAPPQAPPQAKASRKPQAKQSLKTPEVSSHKTEAPQPAPPQKATAKQGTKAAEKSDPAVEKALQWALESSQKVRFRYRDYGDVINHYVVTPVTLKMLGDKPYLEAKYAFKKPIRNFAIDKIDQVEILPTQQSNHHIQWRSTIEQPTEPEPIKPEALKSEPVKPEPIAARPPTPYSVPSIVPTGEAPAHGTPRPVPQNRVAIAQPPTPNPPEKTPKVPHPSTPKRPYINKRSDELQKIIWAEWDNSDKLGEIEHELSFRSRRAALELRQQIAARLSPRQGSPLTWSTAVSPSSKPLEDSRFKQEKGLLREYGYRVGKTGLSIRERRAILDRMFSKPLLAGDQNPEWNSYLAEWGQPRTQRRLKKLAACLAAFSRNAKRRDPNRLAQAIQDWESDLDYLKHAYADYR